MEIFPAIDIKDGKVVRLTQGDYDRQNNNGIAKTSAFVDVGKPEQ